MMGLRIRTPATFLKAYRTKQLAQKSEQVRLQKQRPVDRGPAVCLKISKIITTSYK